MRGSLFEARSLRVGGPSRSASIGAGVIDPIIYPLVNYWVWRADERKEPWISEKWADSSGTEHVPLCSLARDQALQYSRVAWDRTREQRVSVELPAESGVSELSSRSPLDWGDSHLPWGILEI